MVTTSLLLIAALYTQPTRTTPAEIISVCYFNDAKVDATLLNHEVEVTSKVTSVVRDGIGGYIVKMDGRLQTTEFDARSTVHCHFGSASIISLSQIRPGREITIRGVVRKIADDTNHYVDPNVQVTIKNCDLIGE